MHLGLPWLSVQGEEEQDMVAWLIIVAVLAHAKSPHLGHLVYLLSIAAGFESAWGREELMEFIYKLVLAPMEPCQFVHGERRKRVMPGGPLRVAAAPSCRTKSTIERSLPILRSHQSGGWIKAVSQDSNRAIPKVIYVLLHLRWHSL